MAMLRSLSSHLTFRLLVGLFADRVIRGKGCGGILETSAGSRAQTDSLAKIITRSSCSSDGARTSLLWTSELHLLAAALVAAEFEGRFTTIRIPPLVELV